MSPYNFVSSVAPESGSLAAVPFFFLSYPKQSSSMPKTKAFQRVLDTLFASRRLIAVVPKVSAKKTSDCVITAENAVALDRAESYKKSGPEGHPNSPSDGHLKLPHLS